MSEINEYWDGFLPVDVFKIAKMNGYKIEFVDGESTIFVKNIKISKNHTILKQREFLALAIGCDLMPDFVIDYCIMEENMRDIRQLALKFGVTEKTMYQRLCELKWTI